MNSITKETVITTTIEQPAIRRIEKAWACMYAAQELTKSRQDKEGFNMEAIDWLLEIAQLEIGSLAEEMSQ